MDWTPDGSRILYRSRQGSNSIWEGKLYLVDPEGGYPQPLPLPRGGFSTFSADGQRIAFVRTDEDNTDIHAVEKPRDGTWRDEVEEIRLTQGNAKDVSPVWSPDSKSIAFVSSREGNAEIYTMHPDGSRQRRLTNNGANDLTPVWSPDGQQIAFVSYIYGPGEIFVMDADGGKQRRMTNNNVEDTSPDW